jgi:hypothetical protein
LAILAKAAWGMAPRTGIAPMIGHPRGPGGS